MKEWFATLPERRRWWLSLGVISSQLAIGLLHSLGGAKVYFPNRLIQLPEFVGVHIIAWATCLALGFLFLNPSIMELRLPHRSWPGLIWRAFIWSIVLRLSLLPVVGLAFVMIGKHRALAFSDRIGELLHFNNFLGHPFQALVVYGTTAILAGFFEELWRSGFLAGLRRLFPQAFASRSKTFGMIAITATVFGLGHFYQGIQGVAATFVLGLGLGSILIWRNSYWEAAYAHVIFDATTFAGIYYMMAKGVPSL